MNTPHENKNELVQKIFSCGRCGNKTKTVLCKECMDKIIIETSKVNEKNV